MFNNPVNHPIIETSVLNEQRKLELLPAFTLTKDLIDNPIAARQAIANAPKGVMDAVAASAGLPAAASMLNMPFGVANNFANAGVPFWMLMTRDPMVVETILAPLMVDEAYGSKTVGSMVDTYYQFANREYSASGVAYNDYSNGGSSGVTYNQFWRASYSHQTHAMFGIIESEKWAQAGFSWVTDNHMAAIDYLKRVNNYVGFYGVKGLKLWGGLTDPNLPAPISPTAAAAGGVSWDNKTGEEIYNDHVLPINQIITRTKGAARIDNKTAFRVLLPPSKMMGLSKLMSFINMPVINALKAQFPNMEWISVPELETDVGDMMQVIVPEYNGRPTIQHTPSVPLREFMMFQKGSYVEQKKACSSFGSIAFYGLLIQAVLGI